MLLRDGVLLRDEKHTVNAYSENKLIILVKLCVIFFFLGTGGKTLNFPISFFQKLKKVSVKNCI